MAVGLGRGAARVPHPILTTSGSAGASEPSGRTCTPSDGVPGPKRTLTSDEAVVSSKKKPHSFISIVSGSSCSRDMMHWAARSEPNPYIYMMRPSAASSRRSCHSLALMPGGGAASRPRSSTGLGFLWTWFAEIRPVAFRPAAAQAVVPLSAKSAAAVTVAHSSLLDAAATASAVSSSRPTAGLGARGYIPNRISSLDGKISFAPTFSALCLTRQR